MTHTKKTQTNQNKTNKQTKKKATYVPMFGGLASQCTFGVHWRDATPLQGRGWGGGGAGEEGEGGREWGVGGEMGGGGGGGLAVSIFFGRTVGGGS